MSDALGMDKLCIDCRFAELIAEVWMCGHPSGMVQLPRSRVTGVMPTPVQVRCQTARSFNDDGLCGPSGRHWEVRP